MKIPVMKQISGRLLSCFRNLRRAFISQDTPPPRDPVHYPNSLRADEIVGRVDPSAFNRGRDCHLLVCPSGVLPLNVPRVVNGQVPIYRIQEPDGIPRRLPDFPEESIYPDLTISRLSGVICVPGGVAITKDQEVVAETFTCYWDRRFHHALKKSPEGYSLREPSQKPTLMEGKYFFLDFQHISHYGHFIADVLPRLWAYHHLRDHLNINDIRILISRKPEKFIKEILELSDIRSDNIVEIDTPVEVEELFIATKALQLQDYAAPVLRQIWNTVSLRVNEVEASPARVYLSRSRHPQRPLLNELEIEEIFAARGFRVVHPEGLSSREQIELIVGADLIAGPSGSNLFTLAFQQKMRSAFIMTSPALIHITDSLLQAGRSCELRMYIGDLAADHPSYDEHWVHSPWSIPDIADLRTAIDQWLADYS